jgi:hypothetical protein
MKLIIEHLYSENASGQIKSVSGGRDLQKARKLEKQGFARVKHMSRSFAGYGGSRDVGYVCNKYEVTFL